MWSNVASCDDIGQFDRASLVRKRCVEAPRVRRLWRGSEFADWAHMSSSSVTAPFGAHAPSPPRAERVLSSSKLLGGLPAPLLGELARSAALRTLTRGEYLWRPGDRATHFTLVQSGLLKIVRALPDGTDAIVAIFGPRESAGDAAVVEAGAYPFAAVVMSDVAEVIRIEARCVLAAMQADASIALAMNRALLGHTRTLHEKIRVMSAGAVPKRLATLLLCLAERFGDELEGGEVMIPLVVSRGELACLIGARVETTIRVIRGWEKAGVLVTEASGFFVRDVNALVEHTKSVDAS